MLPFYPSDIVVPDECLHPITELLCLMESRAEKIRDQESFALRSHHIMQSRFQAQEFADQCLADGKAVIHEDTQKRLDECERQYVIEGTPTSSASPSKTSGTARTALWR